MGRDESLWRRGGGGGGEEGGGEGGRGGRGGGGRTMGKECRLGFRQRLASLNTCCCPFEQGVPSAAE